MGGLPLGHLLLDLGAAWRRLGRREEAEGAERAALAALREHADGLGLRERRVRGGGALWRGMN